MPLRYDAAAAAANEAAAMPLHHGCRQTGRSVAKYAAPFGDIFDFIIYHIIIYHISADWTILQNVSFWAKD